MPEQPTTKTSQQLDGKIVNKAQSASSLPADFRHEDSTPQTKREARHHSAGADTVPAFRRRKGSEGTLLGYEVQRSSKNLPFVALDFCLSERPIPQIIVFH